jgi:deoxyribonuclease-4
MSIAGGLHLALEEAARHRAGAVQLFTKSTNQWAAKPLEQDAVTLFQVAQDGLGPFRLAAHDSYLINLGSPDAQLRKRSLEAFVHEIRRCHALGIPHLVFHPGAHMGAGEKMGLRRVAQSLRSAIRSTADCRTMLLIENTAGQGTTLGHRLEHLEELLSLTAAPERLGVCLDTCHLLAAGYDFRDRAGYEALRTEVERRIGLGTVRWFHVNDCKSPLGSHVDRHAHIGKGTIGSAPFRFFLTDPVFRSVSMVLETPKEGEADRKNLALLRRLSRLP